MVYTRVKIRKRNPVVESLAWTTKPIFQHVMYRHVYRRMNHLNMDKVTRGWFRIASHRERTRRVGDATEDVRGITVRGVGRAGDGERGASLESA